MDTVQVAAIIGSLIILVCVVELIRRGLLKEKYSILWLFSGVVLLLLSIWRGLLDILASLVGIYYAPSLLFLVAFLFLMLILLHFSVVISRLNDNNRMLAQTVALLKAEVAELRSLLERDKKF